MDNTYTFTILTRYGREAVTDFRKISEYLDRLQVERYSFVRLEVHPPINGIRYLETIYDTGKQEFYTCVLEDRPEGQGFLECTSQKVEKKWFWRLFKRQSLGMFYKSYWISKPIGIQRTVAASGMEECIYVVPFERKSIVYDDNGLYGAAQSNPKKVPPDSDEGTAIRQIIRRYYPQHEEPQIKAFLEKLSAEGCGYVVIVNMLFEHFGGREREFESTFGFPMYADNGDLNYNELLVDYYAATDNHYFDGRSDRINYEEDRSDKEQGDDYDYSLDTTGWGTTFKQRAYRTLLYLKEKGIKVKIVNNVTICPGSARAMCERGYVIISLNGGNVQNEDGSFFDYCSGHAMMITGVTENGRYIVSTWGMKKYVDPNEVIVKDNKETKIYYQYYTFE